MRNIGFVGVGNIGAPMAVRLAQSGFQLTVCARHKSSLESFKAIGVATTQEVAKLATNEMVIIMVANDSQVEEVLLGSAGLLNAVNSKQAPLLAIMSTVLPSTVKKLKAHCNEKNVRLVDAPVSGMPVAAEQGTLTIMTGGDKQDVDAMKPVFEALGSIVYHMGPLGSGEIAKLLNNIIFLTTVFASSEAFETARKMGMNIKSLASIFENSSGRNILTKNWENTRKIFAGLAKHRNLDLIIKDLAHAQILTEEAEVPCAFLNMIVRGVRGLSYQEIHDKWQSLCK